MVFNYKVTPLEVQINQKKMGRGGGVLSLRRVCRRLQIRKLEEDEIKKI